MTLGEKLNTPCFCAPVPVDGGVAAEAKANGIRTREGEWRGQMCMCDLQDGERRKHFNGSFSKVQI